MIPRSVKRADISKQGTGLNVIGIERAVASVYQVTLCMSAGSLWLISS